jgi:hypothetical protein
LRSPGRRRLRRSDASRNCCRAGESRLVLVLVLVLVRVWVRVRVLSGPEPEREPGSCPTCPSCPTSWPNDISSRVAKSTVDGDSGRRRNGGGGGRGGGEERGGGEKEEEEKGTEGLCLGLRGLIVPPPPSSSPFKEEREAFMSTSSSSSSSSFFSFSSFLFVSSTPITSSGCLSRVLWRSGGQRIVNNTRMSPKASSEAAGKSPLA